ncbi:hypothetical protein EDC01DRAFT_609028, partial [Geopyxis carbonaria]
PTMQWLSHIHLGRTTYRHAAGIQDSIVSNFLRYKASPSSSVAPPPTIITSEFDPVYTLGRRERGSLSPSQRAHLHADGRADVLESLRGGQTTFHGPGQLTAYPIVDLKAHGISPKCYIRMLETALIETVGKYGVRGITTEHPGVWVTEDKKIAAVGVHMRRHITSHGIGLNVHTDLWWFKRIVACGLEGKDTTSLRAEGVEAVSVEDTGRVFSEVLSRLLGLDGVKRTVVDDGDNRDSDVEKK